MKRKQATALTEMIRLAGSGFAATHRWAEYGKP
ncbi:hypothetical protein J2X65_004667 [Ancylobacter sp. 3268]|nr:hypothetical protein [Ancylobacter sp. 3268]